LSVNVSWVVPYLKSDLGFMMHMKLAILLIDIPK
jgi:hypothetical protein